jgi:hypothetical protein
MWILVFNYALQLKDCAIFKLKCIVVDLLLKKSEILKPRLKKPNMISNHLMVFILYDSPKF